MLPPGGRGVVEQRGDLGRHRLLHAAARVVDLTGRQLRGQRQVEQRGQRLRVRRAWPAPWPPRRCAATTSAARRRPRRRRAPPPPAPGRRARGSAPPGAPPVRRPSARPRPRSPARAPPPSARPPGTRGARARRAPAPRRRRPSSSNRPTPPSARWTAASSPRRTSGTAGSTSRRVGSVSSASTAKMPPSWSGPRSRSHQAVYDGAVAPRSPRTGSSSARRSAGTEASRARTSGQRSASTASRSATASTSPTYSPAPSVVGQVREVVGPGVERLRGQAGVVGPVRVDRGGLGDDVGHVHHGEVVAHPGGDERRRTPALDRLERHGRQHARVQQVGRGSAREHQAVRGRRLAVGGGEGRAGPSQGACPTCRGSDVADRRPHDGEDRVGDLVGQREVVVVGLLQHRRPQRGVRQQPAGVGGLRRPAAPSSGCAAAASTTRRPQRPSVAQRLGAHRVDLRRVEQDQAARAPHHAAVGERAPAAHRGPRAPGRRPPAGPARRTARPTRRRRPRAAPPPRPRGCAPPPRAPAPEPPGRPARRPARATRRPSAAIARGWLPAPSASITARSRGDERVGGVAVGRRAAGTAQQRGVRASRSTTRSRSVPSRGPRPARVGTRASGSWSASARSCASRAYAVAACSSTVSASRPGATCRRVGSSGRVATRSAGTLHGSSVGVGACTTAGQLTPGTRGHRPRHPPGAGTALLDRAVGDAPRRAGRPRPTRPPTGPRRPRTGARARPTCGPRPRSRPDPAGPAGAGRRPRAAAPRTSSAATSSRSCRTTAVS